MFGDLMMDPSKFQSGAKQIAQRYPVQWSFQNLGWIACTIGDQAVAADMFQKMKGRPIAAIWGQIEYFDRCSAWAQSAKTQPLKKAKRN